jgi:hypothetical protein
VTSIEAAGGTGAEGIRRAVSFIREAGERTAGVAAS